MEGRSVRAGIFPFTVYKEFGFAHFGIVAVAAIEVLPEYQFLRFLFAMANFYFSIDFMLL